MMALSDNGLCAYHTMIKGWCLKVRLYLQIQGQSKMEFHVDNVCPYPHRSGEFVKDMNY